MLLDNFCAKAEKFGINLKLNLTFMLKISNRVDLIKTQLKVPVEDFIDDERKNRILQKVPSDWKYDNKSTFRDVINRRIEAINDGQSNNIQIHNNYIVAELEIQTPMTYNRYFQDLYDEWNAHVMDKEHVKYVENLLKSMATEFQDLNEVFNESYKEVMKTKEELKSYMASAQTSFDALLKPRQKWNKREQIIQEVVCILNRTEAKQRDLAYELYQFRNSIKTYNKKRTKWARHFVLYFQ